MTRTLLACVALLLASQARALELSYRLEGTGFDAGELTLDFDANGDGVSGDVTVASGWLTLRTMVLAAVLTRDSLGALEGGAAHLAGDSLIWDALPTFTRTDVVDCIPGQEALCLFVSPLGTSYPQVTVIDESNGVELSLFDPETGDALSTWSFSPDLRELRRFGMDFGFPGHVPLSHYVISGVALPEPGATALATLALVSLGCARARPATRRG